MIRIGRQAISALFSLVRLHFLGTKRDSIRLGRAFLKTLLLLASKTERAWIEKIECQRLQLNNSADPIRIWAGYNVPEHKYSQLREVKTTVGKVSNQSSVPRRQAFLLFQLVREFKPLTCIEMGTNVGISAAYQAIALALNGRGKLTTLELSRSKVAVAIKFFGALKLKNIKTVSGKFQDTLEDQLEEHKPIDFVFVDGHHDGEATKGYFNQIAPRLSNGALVIFDDIEWSSDMRRAWKHLEQDPRFSTAIAFLNFGVCILKAAT